MSVVAFFAGLLVGGLPCWIFGVAVGLRESGRQYDLGVAAGRAESNVVPIRCTNRRLS